MANKDVTAALLSSAQIGFENILYELKSILETYLEKLNEDATPEPDKATETVVEMACLVFYMLGRPGFKTACTRLIRKLRMI